MRGGLFAVCAGLLVAGAATVCGAMTLDIGAPHRLSGHAFDARVASNRELASYIALRGYPDWAEEVEVDSVPPLDSHEVRIYYLRLNREIAFTNAYILGRPGIGLRLSERPIEPGMRDRIREAFLARHPDRRAALAAARAENAAERAERAADSLEETADRVDQMVADMEDDWTHSLRK
jgi:hypothetical protein